jgi:hypothetical protein
VIDTEPVTTGTFIQPYIRNIPKKYKKKTKKGLTRSRSIRIDEDVYLQLVLLKHGNMSMSDVISFLLLQPGTDISNMNGVALQAPAQTLKERLAGK